MAAGFVPNASPTFAEDVNGNLAIVLNGGQVAPIVTATPSGSGVESDAVRSAVAAKLGTLSVLGDSRGRNGFSFTTDGVCQYTRARGTIHWLNYYLGSPWQIIQPSTGAVSGERTDEWADNHAAVLAAKSNYVYITFPTNDVLQDIDPAVTIARMESYIADHINNGSRIILGTSTGSGSVVLTQHKAFRTINSWLQAKAQQIGAIWLDMLTPTADPTSGAIASGYGYDTTHENAVGCHAEAAFNAPKLLSLARGLSRFTRFGAWDQAAYNPAMVGALVSSAPPGWITNSAGGGASATRSKQARTDIPGGEFYRVAFTSAADTDFGGCTQTISLTTAWATGSKTVGARVRGSYGDHWVCTTAGTSSGTEPAAMASASELGQTVTDSGGVVWTRIKTIVPGVSKITICAEIKVTSTGGAVPRIRCDFTGAAGTLQNVHGLINTDGTDSLPVLQAGAASDIVPAVCTPTVTVPADCTALSLRVYGQAANGSSPTVDIGRVIVVVE